jgi:hypothetical protein
MLNLLVIYDTVADPVPPDHRKDKKDKDATKG